MNEPLTAGLFWLSFSGWTVAGVLRWWVCYTTAAGSIQAKLMEAAIQNSSAKVVLGFKALADPIRAGVLDLLREQELCVCDLSEQLEVAQSKLSFHLKILKEAGLVRARQEGRWVYYSLNLPEIVALEQYLAEFRRFSPMLPARDCLDRNSLSR